MWIKTTLPQNVVYSNGRKYGEYLVRHINSNNIESFSLIEDKSDNLKGTMYIIRAMTTNRVHDIAEYKNKEEAEKQLEEYMFTLMEMKK